MKSQNPNDLLSQLREIDRIDKMYGCEIPREPGRHTGYLYNMHESFIYRGQQESPLSALECYFTRPNTKNFKVKIVYRPYILIKAPSQNLPSLETALKSITQFSSLIYKVSTIDKEDSTAPNHVAGFVNQFLMVQFNNSMQQAEFLRFYKNERGVRVYKTETPTIITQQQLNEGFQIKQPEQLINFIYSFAEYDVNDLQRISIDNNIRCATWYDVYIEPNLVRLERNQVYKIPPQLRVLAFDIETSKQKLCFPNAKNGDQIMCISYMLDGHGLLLVNRSIFSSDIEDFEYSPSEDMKGEFKIFNLQDEKAVLMTFISHLKQMRPHIISTYNGDSFDFKFIDERFEMLGMNFKEMTGFNVTQTKSRFGQDELEYKHRMILHMDCFKWVKRDSYLPQGSQGLKAVTEKKLKYKPMELDPELMTPYAKSQPHTLARYSVSDAVATYYLFKKFIESFILALCTILPLAPDAVLRKGTGTLCESLLMVQASNVKLVYPEKQSVEEMKITSIDVKDEVNQKLAQMIKQIPSGVNCLDEQNERELKIVDLQKQLFRLSQKPGDKRVLISQTYVGGRVEAIQSGIYRTDIEYKFFEKQNSSLGYEKLINELDQDLEYFIYMQNKQEIDDIDLYQLTQEEDEQQVHFYPQKKVKYYISQKLSNYDSVRDSISSSLQQLCQVSKKPTLIKPIIYHLDVAAMYPNIILTNRLSPQAVVDEHNCLTCDYNFKQHQCKRNMSWNWRGIYFPCSLQEYNMVISQVRQKVVNFESLASQEQIRQTKAALSSYCQKTYHAKQVSIEQLRQACICQRENPFYVDTVRSFRDRRYVYKREQKKHFTEQQKLESILPSVSNPVEKEQIVAEIFKQKALVVLNESLQLAHKAILNSFYGYAMRAGSRWLSLEMAASVTLIGSQIIKQARALVELVGLPLELDTDGIWCMLPQGFPENYAFKRVDGTSMKFQYPAVMLNAMTAMYFSNEQFQTRNVLEDLEEVKLNQPCQIEKNPKEMLLQPFKKISHQFTILPECSIEFELDGPYRAMFLSAAKEEGKKIKKRYAVFEEDGSIAELKGFELKRRGELQLIKSYQQRVFMSTILLGGVSLEECYSSVGKISDEFLNILYNEGKGYDERLVLQLLQEPSTMKNSLQNTEPGKKSTAITCARRLSESLDPVFSTVAGLCTVLIISRFPHDLPVSERSIPIQIFDCEEQIQIKFLKLWTKQNAVKLCDIIDWDYYKERFINCLMRIVVCPAGLQGLKQSPVARVPYPEWLQKVVDGGGAVAQQIDIMQFMNKFDKADVSDDDFDEDNNIQTTIDDLGQEKIIDTISVEEVLSKYGIVVQSSLLSKLNKEEIDIKNRIIRREDDGQAWLQQQRNKWSFIINDNQQMMSLRQIIIQQGIYNQKVQGKLGKSIMSQLGGRVASNSFLVINIKSIESQAGILELIVMNTSTKQFSFCKVNVPHSFIINTTLSLDELKDSMGANIIRPLRKQLVQKGKIKNMFEIIAPEQRFLEFYDVFTSLQQAKDVLGMYELEIKPIESFIIKKSCIFQLNNQAQRDFKFGLPLQFDDLSSGILQQDSFFTTQKKEQSQIYLFDGKNFKCEVSFCVHLHIDLGEIMVIMTKENMHCFSSFDLDNFEFKNMVYDQVLQQFDDIIIANQGINIREKRFFTKLVEHFKEMSFQQIKIIAQKPNTNILHIFAMNQAKDLLVNNIVFCLSNSEYHSNQRIFFTQEVNQVNICQNIFINSPLPDSDDTGIADLLLYLMGEYVELEIFSQISKVPITNLLFNENIYKQPQNYRLAAIDFVVLRHYFSNNYVLPISHNQNQQQLQYVENRKQFETAGFYPGYCLFFQLRYLVAQLIFDLDHPISRVIDQLSTSGQLLDYIEQYIVNQRSICYDYSLNQKVWLQFQVFISRIVNLAYTYQIVPSHISPQLIVLATNKINEHLAVNQIQLLMHELKNRQVVKFIYLQLKIGCKFLYFQSANDYIGLSTTNKIVCKLFVENILPVELVDQMRIFLFVYLLSFDKFVTQSNAVSLLQLTDIESFHQQYLKNLNKKLTGNFVQGDFAEFPENLYWDVEPNYDLKMKFDMKQLQFEERPARQIFAPKSTLMGMFYATIFDILELNSYIYEAVLVFRKGMQIYLRDDGAYQRIKDITLNIYCTRCTEYFYFNFARELQLQQVQCIQCGKKVSRIVVESGLIDAAKAVFSNRLADFQYVLQDYHLVGKFFGFSVLVQVVEQLMHFCE